MAKFYIRLSAEDVEGVLAKITSVLKNKNINIEAVLQKKPVSKDNAQIVFVTDNVKETSIKKAIEEIKNLGAVKQVEALYRIEE